MDSANGGGFPPGQLFLGRDGKVFGPYTREQIETMRTSGELAQYHWLWDGSGQWVSASLPPPPPPMSPATPVISAPVIPATVTKAPAAREPDYAFPKKSEPVATAPTATEDDDSDDEITENIVTSGKLEVDLTQGGPVPPASPPLFSRPGTPPPKGKKATPPSAPPSLLPKRPSGPQAVNNQPSSVSVRDLASIRAICFDRNRVVNGTLARASIEGCVFSLKLAIHAQKTMFLPGRPIWLNLIDEATGRSENVRTVLASGTRHDGKLELKLKWERVPALLSGQTQAYGS